MGDLPSDIGIYRKYRHSNARKGIASWREYEERDPTTRVQRSLTVVVIRWWILKLAKLPLISLTRPLP